MANRYVSLPSDPESANPFDAFESASEVLAFVSKRDGPEAFKDLLGMLIEAGTECPVTCEFLERAAEELAQVGLKTAAQLVREAAQEAPAEEELNPYDPASINGRCWLQSLRKRQQRKSLKP